MEKIAEIQFREFLDIYLREQMSITDPLSGLPMSVDGSRAFSLSQEARRTAGVQTATQRRGNYIARRVKENKSTLSVKTELCYNNGQADSVTTDSIEVEYIDLETAKEVCPAELREVLGGATATETLRELLFNFPINSTTSPTAILMRLYMDVMMRRAAKDMIYVRLFGNKNYALGSNLPLISNGLTTSSSAGTLHFFNTLIKKYDGLFAQAAALSTTGQPTATQPIKLVSSNDGSGLSAINPVGANLLFQNVFNACPQVLQQRLASRAPVFCFIDRAIIQAYRDYLYGLQYNTAKEILVEVSGIRIDALQHYTGLILIPLEASTAFDIEDMAAMTTSTIAGQSITHSRNLRGFVCAPGNIVRITDSVNLSGDEPMYYIEPVMDNRRKGSFFVGGFARTGCGILEPENTVFIWATDTTNFN